MSGDGCFDPKCCHGPLSPDYNKNKWLKPGSKPHVALENLDLGTRLLKSIPHFINFRYVFFNNFPQNVFY